MANRFIRNTAVLAKIESAYGVDAVPTGSANAMLVSNLSVPQFDAQNFGRELIRPYFGGSEQLVGTANMKCGFDIELAGSGTAGTPPAWSALLRSCGFAEVVVAGQYVEYSPITDGQESASVYWYDAGVIHKMLGAKATVVLKMNLAERPVLTFSFTGLYGGLATAAVPGTTLTPFKTPKVVTDANSGDITLGCTYAAGAMTGGTAYPSRGIEVNVNNTVNHQPLLGEETVDITARDMSGSFQLDLTAAQEVTFMDGVVANALQSLGFVHGTVPGNTVKLFAPAMQLISPTKQDFNGKRLIGYEGRLTPVAGNDELRLVVA
ncbi:hypothetical protein BH10PSE18_BH10PSE18_15260 [soil metagenome]